LVSHLNVEFNIIKQVIELAQQSLAGRQVHLVSILRALEAMQLKNIITDKQFDLLKLVLMILEKLLPNQSWDSKVSFLESSMIQDQGYICDVHQQNLVPLLTTPGFETASVNESFETESIAEQSRLFLERKALDWRKYIRASKQDRNWILSEWIAATKFWRQRMLKIRFQKWKKAACRISVAQSYRVTSLAKFAFQKWFENVVSSQRQKKKLALRCWRESVKKEKLELVQYQKSQSLKIHFDQWRLKSWYKTIFTPYATECIEQIQSRQRLESLTYYFGIWYAEHTGYHAQYRKLLRLNRTMELGKLSSFFERWKKSTELSLLRRRFQFIVNLNQKRAYFDQWVKLYLLLI
jgi:hypothetical protein